MKRKVFFTGGGTGGHVFPALAIIDELDKSVYDIAWIGSKKGMEYKIITDAGIKFYSIPSGKLRRYFSILNLLDIFKIIAGFFASFILLAKQRPELVFSKGGYVTVPPIIAAKILNIKSITHESDMTPGLATRINSRFVNKILLPYENTRKYFKDSMKEKIIVTGNPVRKDFFYADNTIGKEIMGFNNSKPVLLILGGSLGAQEINDLISESLDLLLEEFNIYHQMGEANFKESEKDNYKTVPFIKRDIAHLIAASDIVISRSGASAVWEFASVGVPSILIPLIAGSRGDQLFNANYAVEKNISLILKGNDVNISNLLELINLIKLKRGEMINSMNEFKTFNASKKISKVIGDIL